MDVRQYTVTAVVLRSRDYGEGHRLITLFTREEGKIAAVAKGVQKPRAKLAASLQHFTLGEMQLAKGRRSDVITQVRVINPFYALRGTLASIAYASYFAELFDESLAEHQQQPALFDLFVDALQRLCAGQSPEMLARYVEIHLIALTGYQPQLTHCALCTAPLSSAGAAGARVWPTWLGFSAAQGGALCPRCVTTAPGARRVAAGTVQVALLLLTGGIAALEGVQLSERLCREIELTFREYLEYRLEHRLQSVRFLRDWGDIPTTEEPATFPAS